MLTNIGLDKRFMLFASKLIGLGLLWLLIEASNILNESGINHWVIGNLVYLSEAILSGMDYVMFVENDIVGIVGTSGVFIAAPCNALDLMALFLGILVLLPGKSLLKLGYGMMGILTIHFLNLLRVITLILLLHSSPELLEFNHTYTFTIVMYVLIFLGWVFWVKRFA